MEHQSDQGAAAVRVLVCGGRSFADRGAVFAALDRVLEQFGRVVLVEGEAPGADSLAKAWAVGARHVGHAVRVDPYPADWTGPCQPDCHHGPRRRRRDGTTYCPAAGNRRNRRMLAEGRPDVVVAFPGSSGTADMVQIAEAARVPVRDGLRLAAEGW